MAESQGMRMFMFPVSYVDARVHAHIHDKSSICMFMLMSPTFSVQGFTVKCMQDYHQSWDYGSCSSALTSSRTAPKQLVKETSSCGIQASMLEHTSLHAYGWSWSNSCAALSLHVTELTKHLRKMLTGCIETSWRQARPGLMQQKKFALWLDYLEQVRQLHEARPSLHLLLLFEKLPRSLAAGHDNGKHHPAVI